jgi:hypothetical protein
MGANDDREMLEVAKEECGRLEREVAAFHLTLAEDTRYMTRIEAERDAAIAQRDASRQVNAEFLAAQSVDVLVEGSYFRADEFPAILGNYMRLSVANSSAMKAGYLHTEQIKAERDAAYAVIAEARLWGQGFFGSTRWIFGLDIEDEQGRNLALILAKSPAKALAERDREAAATALETARDRMMPPLNWNLDPATGNERPGTGTVDEVYHDVHRDMSDMAAEYRTQWLADAHTADLQRQNAVYAASPMPDREGE